MLYEALAFENEPPGMADFVAYLQALGFPHRINERNGCLVLWVYQADHVEWVQEQFRLFEQGALPRVHLRRQPLNSSRWLRRYPVTALLMLLSVVGFLLATLQIVPALSFLSYQGFAVSGDTVLMNSHSQFLALLSGGQLWRLVTPMFLHFSLMHLAFNLVFLGYFAHQIEHQRGGWHLLLWALLISVVANAAQYMASPATLFGGMSGVNYGLLAYCALDNHLAGSRRRYVFPPGLLWVSLVLMLLGFLELFSLFGYSIANWAHLGGFLAGLFLAVLRR